MTKVFIVVRKVAYEGDTIERVFATYNDAVKYADELTAADALRAGAGGFIDYNVMEREVY